MSRRFVIVLLLLLLVTLPLQSLYRAQEMPEMTIYMGSNLKTTVVAGIIHNISISLAQASDDVVLKAYLSAGFTTSNSTNNASWSYSSGVWSDDLDDYYIKNESARYGNEYCFHVALDSQAISGQWHFVIYIDGIEVSNRLITVETPVAGISMSAPTFYFNVIPYGTGYISSWKPDNASASEYMSTRNIGNVPLTLKITFESINTFGTSSSFGATNSTGTYMPQGQRQHFIDFQAQAWSPRKFTVKGYISGEPQLVMTPNTVSTIIAPRTTFDVVVTVARPGYDVYQMDGVSVQYKTFYYSAYNKVISLDLYLTGNKSVYVGHDMQNLTFNFFHTTLQETGNEILMVLNDNVEQHVTVNLTCSSQPPWKQPSMIAYANFNLRLADAPATTGRFTSNIVVSATAEVDDETPISVSIIVVIVLVIVFIAIGAFLFKVYRKTEEQRRKELEDRIRMKKERAKKQRRR